MFHASVNAFAKKSKSFCRALTIFLVVLPIFCFNPSWAAEVTPKKPYYGKFIGDFPEKGLRDHYLAGSVYAVDRHRIFIHKQNYDGKAPMAYFWIGNTSKPDRSGQPIRWPNFGPAYFSPVKETKPLPRAFAYENVLVEMPSSTSISNYRWFSMWCDKVYRSFGHVEIPQNFSPPKPRELSSILNGTNGLSSGPITLQDSKTIFIKDFSLNGTGLGAGFYVGTGNISQGSALTSNNSAHRVPDEFGSREGELNVYSGKDIHLTLPPDVDLMDVDWLSVYSTAKKSHLAYVDIPKDLQGDIPPNLNAMAIGYAGSGGLKGVGIIPVLILAGFTIFIRN